MIQSQVGPGTLSPEEIQERWQQYIVSPTPELREALILQYQPLVKYVMGRMAILPPTGMDYDDILSTGVEGLIQALDRFDPNHGVKFQTYAIARIKGAIIDMLRKSNPHSRYVRKNMDMIEEAEIALLQELGHQPSDKEIREALGMTERVFHFARTQPDVTMVSLDINPFEDGANGVGTLDIADPDIVEVSVELEREDLFLSLSRNFNILSVRELRILRLYYWEEIVFREIAEILGISESLVVQIHRKAIIRLGAVMLSQGR